LLTSGLICNLLSDEYSGLLSYTIIGIGLDTNVLLLGLALGTSSTGLEGTFLGHAFRALVALGGAFEAHLARVGWRIRRGLFECRVIALLEAPRAPAIEQLLLESILLRIVPRVDQTLAL
jgi:hypothetical protein